MRANSRDSEFCKILLDIWEENPEINNIYLEINNSHDIEILAALCQVDEDTDTFIRSIYEDMHVWSWE